MDLMKLDALMLGLMTGKKGMYPIQARVTYQHLVAMELLASTTNAVAKMAR